MSTLDSCQPSRLPWHAARQGRRTGGHDCGTAQYPRQDSRGDQRLHGKQRSVREEETHDDQSLSPPQPAAYSCITTLYFTKISHDSVAILQPSQTELVQLMICARRLTRCSIGVLFLRCIIHHHQHQTGILARRLDSRRNAGDHLLHALQGETK